MTKTTKTAAFERFVLSQDAIAKATAEYDAPDLVAKAKFELMAVFKANGIVAKYFTAPKGEDAKDNEWVSARNWLWGLAAHSVKIGGTRLDAEGMTKVFDTTVANAALICGATKGDWKNRINNQVGDKWGKKVFGEAMKAEEAQAAKEAQAQAAQAEEAQAVPAEQAQKVLLEENKTWFFNKLNELNRRTHKEAGAHIDGNLAELQKLIAACAAQVGIKLKAVN